MMAMCKQLPKGRDAEIAPLRTRSNASLSHLPSQSTPLLAETRAILPDAPHFLGTNQSWCCIPCLEPHHGCIIQRILP